MPTVKEKLAALLEDTLRSLPETQVLDDLTLADALVVEFPEHTEHGDLSSSLALRLARELKCKPRDLAQSVCDALDKSKHPLRPFISKCEVAGPGFVNFFLAPAFFHEIINEAHALGDDYGRSTVGGGKKVNIEFCSTNPTGPLTVAHGRQVAVGDSLASLLSFAGYDATREYYLNDCGNQMTVLARSIYARAAQSLGHDTPFPENGYQGEYITELGKKFADKHGAKVLKSPEDQTIRAAQVFGLKEMLKVIREDLKQFGVTYDVWFSEEELRASGAVHRVIQDLEKKGLTVLKDDAIWLKTTDFGDDKDRVLVKSDGSMTYRTPDIAYHESKFERGFELLIDLFGPDHHQEAKEVAMALQALGHDADSIRVITVQFCTLYRGSERLKMSTRAGQFITLRELIEEVGKDAVRYFFTALKTNSHLNFDLELAKKHSLDNPVYYIQYVSARIASVIRKAQEELDLDSAAFKDGLYAPESIDLSPLEARDLQLAGWIARFGNIIEGAAESLEVHRLCNFLRSFAEQFHNYYTHCRIIGDDPAMTNARLYLIGAALVVLRNGLRILGISAPDRM